MSWHNGFVKIPGLVQSYPMLMGLSINASKESAVTAGGWDPEPDRESPLERGAVFRFCEFAIFLLDLAKTFL